MGATTAETGPTRRLPAGRKAELAAFVIEAGEVTVAQLAERFDVSADTIRRDLDALDADGVLIRTHGGAVSTTAASRPDTGLDVRLRVQTPAKERMGSVAAGIVRDGDSVILNGGTSTLAVARRLDAHRELTVATNSLRLAVELSPASYRELYVFGGQVRPSAEATVGPVRFQAAVGAAEVNIRCDLAIIGVGAVSAHDGYWTSNIAEATMMAAMMDRAERVAVLADSSKLGRRLFAQVADLARADIFITDVTPDAATQSALAAADVELIVADAHATPGPR